MIQHYIAHIIALFSRLVGFSIIFPILLWPILIVITLIIINRKRKIRKLWLICVSLTIGQFIWLYLLAYFVINVIFKDFSVMNIF